MHVKNLADRGGARLLATPTALHLTGVEVLQDAEKKGAGSGLGAGSRQGTTEEAGPGATHMAVMASFWKVTKAMPRGLLWTFSFSFLYSSFSFTSLLV